MATTTTKTKKTAPKSKAKKTGSVRVAPAKKTRGSNQPDVGCRAIARASEGKVNTGQVRVLRALRGRKKAVTFAELKTLVGITGKYSASWLNKLWELSNDGYVKVEEYEASEGGHSKHYRTITPKGRKFIDDLMKSAKDAAKAK